MKTSRKTEQAILKIAQEKIVPMEHREDLERHCSDDEDFLEIAVWGLKDALIAAYELGRNSR